MTGIEFYGTVVLPILYVIGVGAMLVAALSATKKDRNGWR